MYLSLVSWTLVDSLLLLVAFWWKFWGFLNVLSCHVWLQLSCTTVFSLPSSSCFRASWHCILLLSGVQVSYGRSLSPIIPPTSHGSLSSLCQSPELWGPICGSNHLLLRAYLHPCISPSHWIPSHQNRSWPDYFSSYLPDSMWTFLTALVVQEFFCQSPAKFQ